MGYDDDYDVDDRGTSDDFYADNRPKELSDAQYRMLEQRAKIHAAASRNDHFAAGASER